jgi:SEC-C motif
MTEDEPIVRHAEHFLTRLDRLDTREVDLALSLYRDPDLLRAVLEQVSLPESAMRVAISLGDPVSGPFIVVTRGGHFVTCLAEGMTVGALPVVTRGQLDGLGQRVQVLRERMATAAQLTRGSKRPCADLLRRILVKADGVSREEFIAVSAWEPVLAPVFMDLYLTVAGELPLLAPALRRLKGSRGRAEEALHSYWNLVHAASHLALLSTMGGESEHYRAVTDAMPAARAAFAFPLTNTGVSRFVLVGACAAGRLGKQLLPAYKHALAEDCSFFELLDTLFALVAIGRRTSRLRAEIAKALDAAPRLARTAPAARLRELMSVEVAAVCRAAGQLLDADDQDLEAWLIGVGTGLLDDDDQPAPTKLPNDAIRTAALSTYTDGLTDGRNTAFSLSLIAAAARGPAEQFYFERQLLDTLRTPWEPSLTELLLAPHRKVDRAFNQPARREQRPGPNEPCPCGSGRKYKKCCGAPKAGA